MSSTSTVREPFDIGRNKPCFCSSGLRFKQCCGNNESNRKPPQGITIVENYLSALQCQEILEIAATQHTERIKAFDSSASTSEKIERSYSEQRITQRVDMAVHQAALNALITDIIKSLIEPQLAVTFEWFEEPHLLQYQPGGFYGAHADSEQLYPEQKGFIRVMDRDISLLLYLDDDYEGGEILFQNFDFKVKPRRGMLIFFPSDARYLHTALPVTSGTRHCLVSWMAESGGQRLHPPPREAVMLQHHDN